MRKAYVVGYGKGYANWMQSQVVNRMEDADLVVFTGGEDVSPYLYGKMTHSSTCCNPNRDLIEKAEFERARSLGKKMVGICRGSQFLCAMSGGILVQHQENPLFEHFIETYDNKRINVSSTHHQAQYPFLMKEGEYKILGWTRGISKFHLGENWEDELNPPVECENVFYPRTKCLCIQSHPECMLEDIESTEYMQNLLNKFMENKL